ncbi:motility associated factor glycosyltransferase family protein [Brevibacillus centrosporus]|uniref:motility associated factor glycosyltransferase family protein n=1 Tax=Brevibacillus centrosporus TaxID=54910 RepID=UPI0039877327
MILIDNISFLKKKYPEVWQTVNEHQENLDLENIRVEMAKNGLPTLMVQTGSISNFLHSKYDPVSEAEKVIAQFQNIDSEKHVVFYGVGLGYHIEAFIQQHPSTSFSIYEPNVTIFTQYASHRQINKIANNNLKNIYMGIDSDVLTKNLKHLIDHVKAEMVMIVLPTYERIFSEQTKYFIEEFRDKVFLKRATISANLSFAKRLTVNSIMNMPTAIRTPNLLHEKPSEFCGKPAILVSAGPSLDVEIENLRYIKENGLAYIFSVGTSINTLIENGIEPDAAFTYDGSVENQMVFEKVIERDLKSIPLVFGSIVGHELIPKYPGPLLNFVVARDYLTPLYLKREDGKSIDFVDSSKSIAIITLQILYKLGCDPVVLVGQNLAYLGDSWYSKNITYVGKVDEKQRKEAIVVKDVEGKDVYTNRGLDMFRKEMEHYVNMYSDLEVINTTKGGAHIEGTTYVSLDKVIAEKLTERNIVNKDWINKHEVKYDLPHFQEKAKWMNELQTKLDNVYRTFHLLLADMEFALKRKNAKELERLFNKFDKAFDKLQANHFFVLLIQSMNITEFEFLMNTFKELRFSKDPFEKAERVTGEFRSYLDNCRVDIDNVKDMLAAMHKEMEEYAMCVK